MNSYSLAWPSLVFLGYACWDIYYIYILYIYYILYNLLTFLYPYPLLTTISYLQDMGTGLPFRQATFDACISISALQWLCYSNSKAQIPKRRLTRFFSSLYGVLRKHARAVLQFYPETAEQAVLISECATAVGFGGGLVVDYPNSTKAKKHYLVLSCDRTPGREGVVSIPQGLSSSSSSRTMTTGNKDKDTVQVSGVSSHAASSFSSTRKPKPIRKNKGVKTKEWIVQKKETQRKKGKTVRPDTKYTARRRPTKF
jgi:18S rRNA (guanine1575-N7)-methyltransferase